MYAHWKVTQTFINIDLWTLTCLMCSYIGGNQNKYHLEHTDSRVNCPATPSKKHLLGMAVPEPWIWCIYPLMDVSQFSYKVKFVNTYILKLSKCVSTISTYFFFTSLDVPKLVFKNDLSNRLWKDQPGHCLCYFSTFWRPPQLCRNLFVSWPASGG